MMFEQIVKKYKVFPTNVYFPLDYLGTYPGFRVQSPHASNNFSNTCMIFLSFNKKVYRIKENRFFQFFSYFFLFVREVSGGLK